MAFEGDLYGLEIEVELIDYLRGDKHFGNIEDLKAQMSADCERAAAILERAPVQPL
jgi:riboflavin kinase/FMN adenylyltransferase